MAITLVEEIDFYAKDDPAGAYANKIHLNEILMQRTDMESGKLNQPQEQEEQ